MSRIIVRIRIYKGPFTNYVIGIGGGGVSQMIIYDYGGVLVKVLPDYGGKIGW